MGVSAVSLRVRVWVRRSGRRAAVVAVLVGLVCGAVLSMAGGARRTASVPDRFTAAMGGEFDLVLSQYGGAPLTDAIGAVAGVAEVEGATFVAAWPVTDDFGSVLEATVPFAGDSVAFAGRLVEGRYADPDAPDEFTANRPLADLIGAEIGDHIEIAAFTGEQTADPSFDGGATPGVGRLPATLVGITVAGSEFEDPSPMLMYSSGLLDAHPDVGVVASFILIDLEPGIDADDVLAAARGLPGGDGLQRTAETQHVSPAVRRAVHFAALSLWVVVGVSALGAAVVVALLLVQLVGPGADDRRTLRALGWRRRDFAVEALLEAAMVAVGAVVVASVVVVASSGLFPFGAPRLLEPDPGVRVDAVVVGLGALGIVAVGILGPLVNELLPSRSRAAGFRRRVGVNSPRAFWSLPAVVGVRFALAPPPRRRTAWAILGPGVVGCAGLVGALTVGLSLARVVDEPGRWGRNFDYAYGNHWLPGEADLVGPALGQPGVQRLGVGTLGTLAIDGHDVQVLALESIRGVYEPATLEGRAPIQADEIGLGGEVAREIGKQVGDAVQASYPGGEPRELTIVGIVMTPYDAGSGAAMTYDGYAAMVSDATRNLLLVDFANDAGPGAPDALSEATNTQYEDFTSVPPASIRSLERIVPMPYLLATILSLLGAAAMMQGLGSSVLDRRVDLGLLRALGAVGGQLRGVLHWQATTVAAVVSVLGIPVGLFLGRRVFVTIAERVGVTPEPRIAWSLVPVLIAVVVIITNVAALAPGLRASRASTADLMAER